MTSTPYACDAARTATADPNKLFSLTMNANMLRNFKEEQPTELDAMVCA